MLEMLKLSDKVKALVFYTTLSNSKRKSGAAKRLEHMIERKLLFHGCWHHIDELVVGAVWKEVFGKTTTGPEHKLLNQFKSKWGNIDKTKDFRTLHIS